MAQQTAYLLPRIEPEAIGQVEDLFRNVVRRLRTNLINRCGQDVPVRFGAVEIANLGEVFDRVRGQTGAAAGQFRVNPRNVQGFVVLEGPLIHRLVGMFLGEDPQTGSEGHAIRQLTQLDLRFTRRICADVLQAMIASCPVADAEARMESVASNPRTARSLPRSTTVIDVTLDFGPPDDPFGLASVVLPANAEGVLWLARSSRRDAERKTEDGLPRVLPVKVPVVCELARRRLRLSELRELEVGTMIDLGSLDYVKVCVGGTVALVGEAGTQNGYRSVKIHGRVPSLPL